MAKNMMGVGRVTVLPLLHMWPDRYMVIAYTTTGGFGDTAVIGYVPVPGVPETALMDVAARHQPTRLYGSTGGTGFAEACWLICVGWSGRSIPKPGTLELHDAAWSLDLDGSVELSKTMYGHDRLHVGRLTLADTQLAHQAGEVMPAKARAGTPDPVAAD